MTSPNYTVTTLPGLGNWFVNAADEGRILALCSRELDAQLIAKALNAHRDALPAVHDMPASAYTDPQG